MDFPQKCVFFSHKLNFVEKAWEKSVLLPCFHVFKKQGKKRMEIMECHGFLAFHHTLNTIVLTLLCFTSGDI